MKKSKFQPWKQDTIIIGDEEYPVDEHAKKVWMAEEVLDNCSYEKIAPIVDYFDDGGWGPNTRANFGSEHSHIKSKLALFNKENGTELTQKDIFEVMGADYSFENNPTLKSMVNEVSQYAKNGALDVRDLPIDLKRRVKNFAHDNGNGMSYHDFLAKYTKLKIIFHTSSPMTEEEVKDALCKLAKDGVINVADIPEDLKRKIVDRAVRNGNIPYVKYIENITGMDVIGAKSSPTYEDEVLTEVLGYVQNGILDMHYLPQELKDKLYHHAGNQQVPIAYYLAENLDIEILGNQWEQVDYIAEVQARLDEITERQEGQTVDLGPYVLSKRYPDIYGNIVHIRDVKNPDFSVGKTIKTYLEGYTYPEKTAPNKHMTETEIKAALINHCSGVSKLPPNKFRKVQAEARRLVKLQNPGKPASVKSFYNKIGVSSLKTLDNRQELGRIKTTREM